jgi:hypothetical protein
MSTLKTLSERQIAVITGISILIMAVLAGMVIGMVHTPLIQPDNPAASFSNLQIHSTTFRLGILGWTGILITDILAAWGLYLFFKPINSGLALLGGWFRLAYAGILGIAIITLILVLLLTQNSVNGEDQIALVKLFLDGFQASWSFGLLIFGLHLLVLGYLVWNKNLLLKIIAILIIVAGIGYLLTNSLNLLMADYAAIKPVLEGIFMLPMILGEVGLAIWLLVKGGK